MLAEMSRLEDLQNQLSRVRTHLLASEQADFGDDTVKARVLASERRMVAQLEGEIAEAQGEHPVASLDAIETMIRARGPLALRIAEGDEDAVAELAALDEKIRAEGVRREVAKLAEEERARVAADEARRARAAERERMESELEAKRGMRAAALQAFWAGILAAAEHLPSFRELDDECRDLGVTLGRSVPTLRDDAVELALVALQDAGLAPVVGELPRVPAHARRRLLERYPVAEASQGGVEAVTVATCSVCTRADRATIEASLAAGASLREVEEQYGVSRSALSRHAKHGTVASARVEAAAAPSPEPPERRSVAPVEEAVVQPREPMISAEELVWGPEGKKDDGRLVYGAKTEENGEAA